MPGKSPSSKATPIKRGRGRPPKISAEAIIDATMTLLADRTPDAISMADVAAALNIPVMSLYNHYPNSSALLHAVADHTFQSFRFPRVRRDAPWQQRLLAWLRAVGKHCDRYPVALKIISIEGQTSPAWRKILVPVLGIIRELDLDDARAALTLSWLTSQVFGLIYIEEFAHPSRQIMRTPDLDLNETDEAYQQRLERHIPKLKREQVLELGFTAIIDGLERHVARCRGA